MGFRDDVSFLTQPKRRPWIERMSRRWSMAVGFGVATLLFLAGVLLDWLVTHRLVPAVSMTLAGAGMSLGVGFLVYRAIYDAHERHQKILARLLQIAEINHHVRNALQVLAYHGLSERGQGEAAIREVTAAVERIDWVLREVLPGHTPISDNRR